MAGLERFWPRNPISRRQALIDFDYGWTREIHAQPAGACLMCRRSALEALGGFDEGFVLAFNDVDLCLSVLAKGYRVVWTPDAELYHLESKTRGPEDTAAKEDRFRREYELFHLKWGHFLRAGDPYYSPHFRLDRPDFALKAA